MEKKRNKDGEMEMFSVEFTNSRGEKEDGLVIEYYDGEREKIWRFRMQYNSTIYFT